MTCSSIPEENLLVSRPFRADRRKGQRGEGEERRKMDWERIG
jgi:hypothetical protein